MDKKFSILAFGILIILKCLMFNVVCGWFPLNLSLKWCMTVIATAAVVASPLFLTKRNRWTIIVAFILDAWIIANLFYYRANSLFLSVNAISMAGNMNGFWASLKTYASLSMLVFPALTIIYALVLHFFVKKKSEKRSVIGFISAILIALVSCAIAAIDDWKAAYPHMKEHVDFYLKNGESDTLYGQDHLFGRNGYKVFRPYQMTYIYAKSSEPIDSYPQNRNIISYIPAIFLYHLWSYDSSVPEVKESEIEPFIDLSKFENCTTPKRNVIILLCESLESWLLEPVDGVEVMPNLKKFASGEHILFSGRIKSQARHGVSGDGQMTLLTGLLPIKDGGACMLYGNNDYPSFLHCYSNTAIVTPDNGWNQAAVNGGYGFNIWDYSKVVGEHYQDSLILAKIVANIDTLQQPFCLMGVTYSMHTPFNHMSDQGLDLPDGMPQYMRDYLNCAKYTDNCMKQLFDKLETSGILDNSIVVITGDHTIFKKKMLEEFRPSAEKYSLSIANGENYVPLIIYSPDIKGRIDVKDLCYQMDIYPTILSLLGKKDYYWKGFGADLTTQTDTIERKHTETELYNLSDKLIRANWFHTRGLSKGIDQNYIAHAGGSMDGDTYLNCLECAEQSLRNGINYIEFDLALTSDSALVASHFWDKWHKNTDGSDSETAPSLAEFRSSRILGKYRPVDFAVMDSLLQANEDMHIVTDIISDPSIIERYFGNYKERVIVECFSDSDYFVLKDKGYKVLRSQYPPAKGAENPDINGYIFKMTDYNVLSRGIKNLGGDEFGVYVADTKEEADRIFALDRRIKFVYIDKP